MDLNTIPQAELIEYILNRRDMGLKLSEIRSKMSDDYKISPWMLLSKDNPIDNLLIRFIDSIIYKFYRETDISNLSYEERYALDYSLVMQILEKTDEILKEVDKLYYDKYANPDSKSINYD